MKRQQMVEYMAMTVRALKDHNLSVEHVCSILLECMENEGMLPPPSGYLTFNEMTHYYGNDWLDNDYPRRDVHVWEFDNEVD